MTPDTWAFSPLKPLSYDLIVADPPWEFITYSNRGLKKSAQAHYRCMHFAEIIALPVSQLARGDAMLFLWATWPFLERAMTVMGEWGFRYKTGGAWHKRTVTGKTAFGTGYLVRNACDPWLIGTIGSPVRSKAHRNLFEGLARQHSRKPDVAYAWCESYAPHIRRCELFSRESRPGWEVWGDETGKYNGDPHGLPRGKTKLHHGQPAARRAGRHPKAQAPDPVPAPPEPGA